MLKLLRKRWWKYAAVLLLLFALVAGLYTPLSPGITSVSPERQEADGQVTISIETYNTSTTPSPTTQVFLSNDSLVFCATNIAATDKGAWQAIFDIPAGIITKTQIFSVVIQDSSLGTFRLSSSVTLLPTDAPPLPFTPCVDKIAHVEIAAFNFPYRVMLYESIRNLFFHVPMWFTMVMLLLFSFGSSIAYLNTGKLIYDTYAAQAALVALLFGALGIVTGMVWAKFTWGDYWPPDPKLNGAAVGMLTYLAYFVLRGSLNQREQKARVAAVYGIFAFIIFIVFIFVLPRLNDSLHPGSGGNDQFAVYDLNNRLRIVFYSAAAGFILLGYWIMSLRIRYSLLQEQIDDQIDTPYESTVS